VIFSPVSQIVASRTSADPRVLARSRLARVIGCGVGHRHASEVRVLLENTLGFRQVVIGHR